MPFFQRFPRLIRWITAVVLSFLALMTLGRFIVFWKYNPPGKAFSGSAFIMGLRFDARIVCLVGLLILLLCAIPYLNPFKNIKSRRGWNIFLPVLFLVLLFFYAADYYHFDYLHQRLNASVLNYLQDAGISYKMVWQTYPLFRILAGLIILTGLSVWYFRRLLKRYQLQPPGKPRKGILYYAGFFLLLGIGIFGKIGQYPLRWSDAYTLSDDFKANLALNPFQSFFSTLDFRNSSFDRKKVAAAYPEIARYLGVPVPDSTTLNYERIYSGHPGNTQPNVVLVICESFSAYKSSMYGNPLNTTPFFSSLCNNGVFFDHCFTPAYGTARGVWATITGIPDVENPKTASRNPGAVDQHTIINDFYNYEHFYFLGGSATWANIRGLLTNNISNLQLYEENSYKAAKIDVWGISDKNLFLESNKILKEQSKPFFAVIQTADNHRPYTIPDEDKKNFPLLNFPADTLKKYGFESNEEMNAFRYTDYCYEQFINAARKEKYFANTIFVFVGDHGIRYNGQLPLFPRAWTEQGLTCEHVPLLFYAPALLPARQVHEVCSQVDILPSVAALAGIPFRNSSFGRNLFDTSGKAATKEKYAFVIDHDVKTIGLVSNRYYYLKNFKTGKEEMVSVLDNDPVPANASTDSVKKSLARFTDAYYETAKYLLLNNKKKKP